ncbi:cytidine deaminase [Micromonospora echinofusca]|uniref:Cytidine deaminase n=1 Tax=Micromonospora echinofusca TaxID=47858 RepID=A0ABS3VQG8_MICEH|nr:cytidine deaminase [Micromonospora echinofusca]MBO4206726.1 cytidine deaminase [Micromonospora echinofusca]
MTADQRGALRVALFGLPGAGKSTSAGLLREVLAGMGRDVAVVKTAAPLYDVQAAFYERVGTALAPGQQDGALLNFLGSHFRQAAPGFLLTDFARRWGNAVLGGADTVLCDDARPVDLPGLAGQGFRVVRIVAPDALRRERKSGRGDRIAGRDDHPTEAGGEQVVADFEVDNAGTLDELRERIVTLARELVAGPASPAGPVPLVGSAAPVGPVPLAGSAAPADLAALVDLARATISARYAENRHQIGAVIVAGDGRVFTGVHLEAMVGRASICAEAVALGRACAAGATDLRIALAVRHPKPSEARRDIKLVPPCGLCRELLLDYGPDIRVVVDAGAGPELVALAGLLPHKYVGTKWAALGGATADRR